MEIDFDKMDGLVPAVIQDAETKNVLMLGFMNREAYDKTLETGKVTFFSRSKNRLWTKGGRSVESVSKVRPVETFCMSFPSKTTATMIRYSFGYIPKARCAIPAPILAGERKMKPIL